MAEGPATHVGARLREAREKKGVALRQIAATTRISVMTLEALERNDLSRLPGGIFTRAFIRAYAAEVGLDPERSIQEFIAQFPQESVAGGTGHASQVEEGETLESDRRAVETAFRLVLVSLPIAAIVIYFGMRGRSQSPPDTPVPAVSSLGQERAPDPPVTDAVPAPQNQPERDVLPLAAAVEAPTGLMMAIAPRGTCWVSVTVDGEQNFSGLMNAGDQRQLTAQSEIVLMIGDAGVFTYTLNGVPGRPMGAPGEVVSRRITLANYKDYLAP